MLLVVLLIVEFALGMFAVLVCKAGIIQGVLAQWLLHSIVWRERVVLLHYVLCA